MHYILTVDDDLQIRWVLKNIFEAEGYSVIEANSGAEGLNMLQMHSVDVVILDLQMPGMDGITTMSEIRKINPHIPIIILTGYGEVRTAIEATKLGAHDYLSKPFERDDLVLSVQNALEKRSLLKEVTHWRETQSEAGSEVIAESDAMKRVMAQVHRVAPTDYTVFIYGETGTGKDVLANYIHAHSKRSQKIFVPVDCGAIPDNLVESELFGYEKGAFTGADKRKEGLFELAEGGTIFLDELGNLSLAAQAKFLRVLQERKIMRIGAKQHKEVNVRVIVATNLKVDDEIKNGRFREDLYYRLNEFSIELPVLKDRKEDIIPLALQFMKETSIELAASIELSAPAAALLESYHWPGNIRELKNVVRFAALHSDGVIEPKHVQSRLSGSAKIDTDPTIPTIVDRIMEEGIPLKQFVREFERLISEEVVKRVNGNNKQAAEKLGLHYTTLLEKLKNTDL